MQARAAYISSVGTTTILVAGALLMLAVVSALVAFRAWPGDVAADSATPVPLEASPRPAPVEHGLPAAPAPPAARDARSDGGTRSGAAAAEAGGRDARGRSGTAGLIKVRDAQPSSSPAPASVPGASGKAPASGPSVPQPPAAPPAAVNVPAAPVAPPAAPPALDGVLDSAPAAPVGQDGLGRANPIELALPRAVLPPAVLPGG